MEMTYVQSPKIAKSKKVYISVFLADTKIDFSKYSPSPIKKS